MSTSVCIHQYVYIRMYAFVCIDLYVCTCMYISVCIHLYAHICLGNFSKERIPAPPSAEPKKSDLHPESKTILKQLYQSTSLIPFGLMRPVPLFDLSWTRLGSEALRLYVYICMYTHVATVTPGLLLWAPEPEICMYTSICIHLGIRLHVYISSVCVSQIYTYGRTKCVLTDKPNVHIQKSNTYERVGPNIDLYVFPDYQ